MGGMSRAMRLTLALVLGLAGMTFGTARYVQGQMRTWFEKDVNLRARLAVNGARGEIGASWSADPARLYGLLSDLTQDERIMGACACDGTGATVARTDDYPSELGCQSIVARIAREGLDPAWDHWTSVEALPGGEVHFSALPLAAPGGGELGWVVLAHDLSFWARRDARTRLFLLVAFGVLALGASLLTLVASRLSWRDWSEELRGFLRGDRERKEFQPILADVRELVDRLMEQEGRAWTPERLKETLRHSLSGEKVVVLANREPYVHHRTGPSSAIEVMHPASGLVTALEPILRACGARR